MATGAVVEQHGRARTEAVATVRATVASTVTKVRTEMRAELAAGAGAPAIAIVPADRVAHSRISTAVAVLARDSGAATLDDASRPPAVVTPVFRDGATPGDTATRRRDIVGYRVVPLALQPTLADLQPLNGGLVVRGPHRMVANSPSPPPPGALSYAVDMDITGSPGWVVQAWLPDPGRSGRGLAVGAGNPRAVRGARRRHRLPAAPRRRSRRPVTRARARPRPGHRPGAGDAGEPRPGRGGARGLGTPGATAWPWPGSACPPRARTARRPLFTWGTPPDPAVRPFVAQPDRLGARRDLALALTRGGRTLGILRIVAGEP